MRLVWPFFSVWLKTHASANAPNVPSAYMESIISALLHVGTTLDGNMAAISSEYTGSLAEQLASGVTRMVMSRSFGLAIVRVAMIPGTAHAYELRNGTNDFPFSPTRPIS